MTQFPGTHIDVAKLSDEVVKSINLDNPDFHVDFTPEFIKAVEQNKTIGATMPPELYYRSLN